MRDPAAKTRLVFGLPRNAMTGYHIVSASGKKVAVKSARDARQMPLGVFIIEKKY
jgi:hypothetical protein